MKQSSNWLLVIRPREDEVTEVEVPQVAAAPISADVPDAEQQ